MSNNSVITYPVEFHRRFHRACELITLKMSLNVFVLLHVPRTLNNFTMVHFCKAALALNIEWLPDTFFNRFCSWEGDLTFVFFPFSVVVPWQCGNLESYLNESIMWFVFQWRPRCPDKLPRTPQGPWGHGDRCALQRPGWVRSISTYNP